MTDTISDIDTLEHLDFDPDISCDPEFECTNKAEWKMLSGCCNVWILICQEHYDKTMRFLDHFYAGRSKHTYVDCARCLSMTPIEKFFGRFERIS